VFAGMIASTCLAVLFDAFSRRVIGWALDAHLRTSRATTALKMAIQARRRGGRKLLRTQPVSSFVTHHRGALQVHSSLYFLLFTTENTIVRVAREARNHRASGSTRRSCQSKCPMLESGRKSTPLALRPNIIFGEGPQPRNETVPIVHIRRRAKRDAAFACVNRGCDGNGGA
jgi:hypothetical protein